MSELTFDPISRPGLAYQHAFDWLAVQLHEVEGTCACRARSAFHAAELLRRLPAVPLLPSPGITGAGAAQPRPGTLAALAWIEPLPADLDQLALARQWLRPDGRLFLVVGGRLGRLLAERRGEQWAVDPSQTQDGQWTLFLRALRASVVPSLDSIVNDEEPAVMRALRRHGFAVTERIGLHGVRAIGWHLAGLAAGRLGRVDWQDRCLYGLRRDFVETGRARHLVALTCLVAEPIA